MNQAEIPLHSDAFQINGADRNCSSPKVYLHYSVGEPCVYPRFQHLILQTGQSDVEQSGSCRGMGDAAENCFALEFTL